MWPMLMRLGCAMSQMSATFGVEKFSKMDVTCAWGDEFLPLILHNFAMFHLAIVLNM